MSLLALTPLAATGCAAAALAVGVRRWGHIPFPLAMLLAAALAGSELVVLLWPAVAHTWTAANSLPFQLSDIATGVSILALLRPRPGWRELAYLWGVSAGLLGLSFPAIGATFPSPLYFAFYVDHGTLVTVGILMGVGGQLHLGWRAVAGSWVATTALAGIAGVVNLATGGDYMFLRQPPGNWNPLLIMGPGHWYILTAWVLCPLVFSLLAVPVWGRDSGASRGPAAQSVT